jgi:hypothetical protein
MDLKTREEEKPNEEEEEQRKKEIREYSRKYYHETKEYRKEYNKKYIEENRERVRTIRRKYQQKKTAENKKAKELLKLQGDEPIKPITIRKKRTEPEKRNEYKSKYNFKQLSEDEKLLKKAELKNIYNKTYNEKRKIKKKEEQQQRLKEKEEFLKLKNEKEFLINKLKELNAIN